MQNLREYFRPERIDEAIDVKKSYGERAAFLAGGSDLLVVKPQHVEVAIDIRHIGLGYVWQDGGDLVVGGAALLRDVEAAAPHLAGGMLREAVRHTAPWLIRNAATLAGNLANASPAADSIPALIALDTQLVLMNGQEERVGVSEILLAPHRTSLGNRLIKELRIPVIEGQRGVFIKHARSASDIAQVNVAITAQVDGAVFSNVRLAFGAVAPVPMRARAAEELVEGQELTPELLRRLEETVREEVRPISDWRASESYRRQVSGVLARRGFAYLLAQSGSGA